MSKNLSFKRDNTKFYVSEFIERNKNIAWPPKEGVLPLVKSNLQNLVIEEIRELFSPQLKAMGTTADSNSIINIVLYTVRSTDVSYYTVAEYYMCVSDIIFAEIEEKSSDLVGCQDTCKLFSTE